MNAMDPFAALGLPRRFDLDDATISAARDRTNDSAAYDLIATPRARAETRLRLLDTPDASDYVGLPGDFADAFAQAHGDPARLAALKAERWNIVTHLFRQRLGFDKAPVQIGRSRMIRAELNAIDSLERS